MTFLKIKQFINTSCCCQILIESNCFHSEAAAYHTKLRFRNYSKLFHKNIDLANWASAYDFPLNKKIKCQKQFATKLSQFNCEELIDHFRKHFLIDYKLGEMNWYEVACYFLSI
jgi:hypothetical protein